MRNEEESHMTSYQPLVSIIMPAYNAFRFISESIDSVLAQTYQHWELIVIDDGSNDPTPTIVKEKVCRDSRIVYLHQENGRQAKARNLGLMHARGELIAFLDADDLWLETKLEVMVHEFAAGNQDLLFSGSYVFEDTFCRNNINPDTPKLIVATGEYSGHGGLSDFLDRNKIPMLSVVVKAEIIKRYRFNEVFTPAEDYDLWLRMLIDGYKFRSIEQPLAAYRLHSASSTSGDRLVTDTVIRIINTLRQTVSGNKCNTLVNLNLRKWLHRKLKLIEDGNQLKQYLVLLREVNILPDVLVIMVMYFNLMECSCIHKINKKLLDRMLRYF